MCKPAYDVKGYHALSAGRQSVGSYLRNWVKTIICGTFKHGWDLMQYSNGIIIVKTLHQDTGDSLLGRSQDPIKDQRIKVGQRCT